VFGFPVLAQDDRGKALAGRTNAPRMMFIPELSMNPFTPHSAVVVKREMRLNGAHVA